MLKRTDTKPWERQEGESIKAFEAFSAYLDMGEDRSIRAVAQKLDKSRTLIGRWSTTYKWVERAAARNDELRREAHEQAIKNSRRMAERHISIALKLQEKALEALKNTKPENIDPKNLLAFIREATKLERDTRADIVRETDPAKDEERYASSLADVIAEAWERRQQNETDK